MASSLPPAASIAQVFADFGLRPVELLLPEKIDADDLGVVCWMTVLPAAP